MATVTIEIGGQDITEHVIYSDAEFTSAAKGRAGTARFRIKDLEHVYSFSTGDTLTVDIDGQRKWDGFVGKIERGYFFEADCTCKVPITPRYLLIDGMDRNYLLQKRVLYDKSTLTNLDLTRFPTGTMDSTVLIYYLTNHTDLLSDGITTSLIEAVDTPFVDAPVSGNASWTVDQFCRYLTSETGAIYYIDPDRNFVLTDVDTPNAPFGISDDPDSTEVGCRELEIDFDGSQLRNDALAWGVGQGSQTPVFARVTDATSVAEHGVWQVGKFTPSIWRQATIDRVADSYIYGSPQNRRGGKDDQTTILCTVFEPDFRVAQKVAFRSDTFGFEDVIPIRSEKITFDTPTDPRFQLTLGHEIDDPWTTFEFWFPPFPPFPPPPDFPLPQLPSVPCLYRCEWEAAGFADYTYVPTWNHVGTAANNVVKYGDPVSVFHGSLVTETLVNYSSGVATYTGGTGWKTWDEDLIPEWDVLFVFTLDNLRRDSGTDTNSEMDLLVGGLFTYFPQTDTASLSGPQGIFLRFTSDSTEGWGWSPSTGSPAQLTAYPWQEGVRYAVRVRVEGPAIDVSSDRTASVKIWDTNIPEPEDWLDTQNYTSSRPALSAVSLTGGTNFAPANPADYKQVDFHYIGPYEDGCSEDFLGWQETGQPFCEDNFNRLIVDGWGTGECAVWSVDPTSYVAGAYVDGSEGHFITEVGGNETGPSLSMTPAPTTTPSVWQAKMILTCVDRGSGNRIDIAVAGSGSQYSEINAHRIQFTLDPPVGVDTFNIIHADVSGGGGLDAKPFTFVNGSQYELAIIVTDSSTAASITDLSTGVTTSGLTAGSKPITNLRFIVRLVRGVSLGQGLTSHFTIDDLEFRALNATEQGLIPHVVTCPPDNAEPPCIGQETCENLARMDTPSGGDPLRSYLQSIHQFQPGSTEVWVDGLRIDYRDYIEHPSDAYIEILEHIDIGGTEVTQPSKTVRMCYYATCLGD